jgi:hypothetical protein
MSGVHLTIVSDRDVEDRMIRVAARAIRVLSVALCLVSLLSCGDSSTGPTEDSPFQGEWTFAISGDAVGSGACVIQANGSLTVNLDFTVGGVVYPQVITGSVRNTGALTGTVYLQGSQIGSVSGNFTGSTGSGTWVTTLAGSGTWTATKTGATVQRIVKQELLSVAGVLSTYWLYSYDAAGLNTEIRAYTAANVLTSTTVLTTVGGYRTLATSRDTNGVVTGTTAYSYTTGVLSRTNYNAGNGTLTGYSTYAFLNGRKMTTFRFTATGVSLGRTDFTYDAVTGRRTTATTQDSLGVVTMTSTRTYVGGVWTQSQLDYPTGGDSIIRRFTYETGVSAIDADIFFEF